MDETKEQAVVQQTPDNSGADEREVGEIKTNHQQEIPNEDVHQVVAPDVTPAELHTVRSALQSEGTANETVEQGETIEQRYAALRAAVERKGDPAEEISIGDIQPGSDEYNRLVAVGVSEEKIQAGRVTRQELLSAGFVFLNDLGGFEKRFIHATIENTDFSTKTLLTAEELQKVREYQQEHPDQYGFGDNDPDEVCEDMLRFLLAAKDPRTGNVYNPVNVINEVMGRIRQKGKQHMNSKITAALVEAQLESRYKAAGINPKSKDPKVGEQMAAVKEQFIYDTMADIYPWRRRQGYPEYRGLKFEDVEIREKALRGKPSPFLESDFHFTDASDLRVETQHAGVVRLNVGNIIMAMGGLSEMGDGGKQSYDQHYITTGEYVQDVLPPSDQRVAVNEDANRRYKARTSFDEKKLYQQMEARMEALTEEWVTTGDAPLHMRLMARSRGFFS